MDARALLFLIVLFTFWCCDDASRVVVSTTSLPTVPEKWKIQNELGSDEGWCTFCEVILVPIIDTLSNTTNQADTLCFLHMLCSLTLLVKDECFAVVDHYVPLIFNETSRLTPRIICTEIGLCVNQTVYHHHIHNLSENNFESSHNHQSAAVTQSYSDKQMQRVREKLLEACNSLEDSAHVTDCRKRIVLAKCSDYPKTILDA